VDARQMSLFAASWFLRSVAVSINGTVAGANYFELVGCKGIMEEQAPNRDYPFASTPDMLFPLYYAFYALRGLHSFDITATVTACATVLVLRKADQTRLILANPQSEAVTLRLTDAPSSMRGLMLDENSVAILAQKKVLTAQDDCLKTYNLNGEIQLNRYSVFIAEL
jgi:hypothetical protein